MIVTAWDSAEEEKTDKGSKVLLEQSIEQDIERKFVAVVRLRVSMLDVTCK